MFNFGKKKYNVGIVLGGGGARGFAHLGVLQALKERNITPDIISGVSAGAIVGAFIAAGKTTEEALEIIKEYKYFEFSRLRIPKTGLLSLDSIQQSIKDEIKYDRLEDLPTPLVIAATDILQGRIEYFQEGSLPQLVQASSAIPVIFDPVNIQGKLYSDGGIFDNLPLYPLQNVCKKTIVVNISPIQQISELKNLVHVAARMFQLTVNSGRIEKMHQSNLYIEPQELRNYDILDTKHAREIFDLGYKHVMEMDVQL